MSTYEHANIMLLTYKIKHYQDYTKELIKAKLVAQYALTTKSRSSKDVKDIGLKSAIANQILKKYSTNAKLKRIKSVKLTLPAQSIKVNKNARTITLVPLKLTLEYYFANSFIKVNQVELDHEYAYISVTIPEAKQIQATSYIGLDLNTTGHCAVVAHPTTGKVFKLGKKGLHVHKKYAHQRARYQRKGKYKKLKASKDKETRIVKDMLHKTSKAIIDFAYKNNAHIKLEDLTGIRDRVKVKHTQKYTMHSWSYYKLAQLISYKAKLLGIAVIYVNPAYTSKTCSKCSSIGTRAAKVFKCLECGHVDHADVNAAFNIALRHTSVGQLNVERDTFNRSTDSLEKATL